MSDAQVIEKAKRTMAQIILVVIVAPLALVATVWLFTTVVATNKSVTVIEHGVGRMVSAVEDNTAAVKRMDKDNAAGHATIAAMVYSVKEQVTRGSVRLDSLEQDCVEHHIDIGECKKHMYQNGGTE